MFYLGCKHIFSNGSDVYFILSTLRVSFDDANRMCENDGGKILQISNQERKKFSNVSKDAYLNSKILKPCSKILLDASNNFPNCFFNS